VSAQEWHERWHEIADRLDREAPTTHLGGRICSVASVLMASSSVGLALVIGESFSAISGSDTRAVMLDEEQFVLGQGPSVEAAVYRLPVAVDDLQDKRSRARWPAYIGVADRYQVGSQAAFPLRSGAACMGVLTSYRTLAGPLSADEYADGLVIAAMATVLLLREQAGLEPGRLADVFVPGVDNNARVQLAAGMLAEQLTVGVLEALARMRAYAFAHDLSVTDVARLIADRQLILER
jgi:hypothetical protein